jgi:hypothetical protein
MAHRFIRVGAPAFLLILAAGCTQDPFDRPGTWRSTGANDRNLRAMIAEPAHLRVGAAARAERGDAGSNAATRLLTERRRPLPAASATTVGGAQQPDTAAPLPGLGIAAGSAGAAP